MTQNVKQILLAALKAISKYIVNYKPEGEAGLKAQLRLINEIAIGAIEQAEEKENA